MWVSALFVVPIAYISRRRVEHALWYLHTGERAGYLAAAAALSVAAMLYVQIVLMRGLGDEAAAPPPPPVMSDEDAHVLAAAMLAATHALSAPPAA